jgi:hypothetical protein
MLSERLHIEQQLSENEQQTFEEEAATWATTALKLEGEYASYK